MRFLLDNNLSPRLAEALRALAAPDGDEVYHLKERFPRNAKDVEWIGKLGAEGDWIVISGDLRIWKTKHEREALRKAKITTFFLGKSWRNWKFWDMAWRLVRWWPFISAQARMVQPGAIFEIPLNVGRQGKFKQIS